MEVKIRNIGNSIGIIFPKQITKIMNFHVEDVIELDVDPTRGSEIKKTGQLTQKNGKFS